MKALKSVLSVVVMSVVLAACAPNYSNGDRTGVVTKLSQKGIFFKSWEGEMLMALPSDVGGAAIPEKFAFTVDDSVVP